MLPIYKNIKAIAKEKGIPLCHIERKAGISAGSINHWNENSPLVSTLQKVADVLEVDISTLTKETR